MIYTNM